MNDTNLRTSPASAVRVVSESQGLMRLSIKERDKKIKRLEAQIKKLKKE